MRVSTTALYTLAALIAGDLTQQAIAKPVSDTAPKHPEAGDIESAAELVLPSSVDSVTPPEQLQAIAFAEAVLTQYSEEYTRELTEVSDLEAEEIVSVAIAPDDVGAAEISTAEINIAAVNILATMPAPEMTGVTFSNYYESVVAPPEAIARPERLPSEPKVSEPKFIEAIATPEFFMPEQSERLLNDLETPVNVLLPITLSSEATQTYALNSLEEEEDLWIQAMIESEFAQESTADWVTASAMEFEEGAIASIPEPFISSTFSTLS
ncbi:MAG: hypothetical protein HC899_24770 [Leptolyngbyaceae cyanobacterium SM1_4_3]|nr:hypothetical protein [Leptolyngbyaceae cyanobacterium SM1_4_3]NJN91210.1 hypothetical protein [Leptolyngbyaceae cyanobacterium SL_5_14]